jgi:inorganic triphosphatase YgiF
MSAAGGMERELKLGVWPEFELPNLAKSLKGGTMAEATERRLEAVYYDTSDLLLLRRGVTLRFRRGEDPGPVWTAKLPSEAVELGLARREVTQEAEAGPVPERLRDLTRGWALGARIEPIARMVTTRRSVPLLDSDGAEQASIDDDDVSVLRGRQVAARFRELEVELSEHAEARLLSSLAKRLRSAGAQPVPQVPKLMHALGAAAAEPWGLTVPELSARPNALELLRARLIGGAGPGLVDHHAAIVLDENPEALRAARRAVCRLVGDLRAFEPLLDIESSTTLCGDLMWLAAQFGRVETADRQADLVRSDAASSGTLIPSGDELETVMSHLGSERARTFMRLLATLRTARYRDLLPRLAAFAADPPTVSSRARRRAATVVPALVRRALRDLRAEVAAAPDELDDPALRQLEWPVERLMSAVDAAVPVVGTPARRAAREVGGLWALLRDHREAFEAAHGLRAAVAGAGEAGAWVAGVTAGIELQHAAGCRARFPRAWRHLSRKSRWAWLD